MEKRVSVLFLSVQAIVSMKMGLSKKGLCMSCCLKPLSQPLLLTLSTGCLWG